MTIRHSEHPEDSPFDIEPLGDFEVDQLTSGSLLRQAKRREKQYAAAEATREQFPHLSNLELFDLLRHEMPGLFS